MIGITLKSSQEWMRITIKVAAAMKCGELFQYMAGSSCISTITWAHVNF
jgi:hypothetical protein